MTVDTHSNGVLKVQPTSRLLPKSRGPVKSFPVRSHLAVRLSGLAARELRDQAHSRLGNLLAKAVQNSFS